MSKGPVPTPPMQRIWKYIRVSEGCWEWIGYTHKGYGQLSISPQRIVRAYRFLYIALVGDPGKLTLDHLCANTLCVRPDHLEPVTHAENCRRAARTPTGRAASRRRKIAMGWIKAA